MPAELLSNLAWIAVAIVLWGFWIAQRSAREGPLLPRIGLQVTALAMLTAILLPVISVSDDLQASLNPAEVERVCGRTDQHRVILGCQHPTPMGAALTSASPNLFQADWTVFLAPEFPAPLQIRTVRVPWSRPPPIANNATAAL